MRELLQPCVSDASFEKREQQNRACRRSIAHAMRT
jgi:hypothetical protein